MGTRLTFIPPAAIKVATAYRLDLTQFLVGIVWLAPGSTNGIVRLWKVNLSNLSNAGEISFVKDAGKDDSIALEILADGSVLVTVSEATPDGGGATSQPEVYRIPAVFPAYVVSSGTTDQALRAALAALPK